MLTSSPNPSEARRRIPRVYAMRGEGPNIRISEIRDPATEQLIALKIVGVFGRADRTVGSTAGRIHPNTPSTHGTASRPAPSTTAS